MICGFKPINMAPPQIRVFIFSCTFSNNKLVVWETNYKTFNLCIFNHMCGAKFKS